MVGHRPIGTGDSPRHIGYSGGLGSWFSWENLDPAALLGVRAADAAAARTITYARAQQAAQAQAAGVPVPAYPGDIVPVPDTGGGGLPPYIVPVLVAGGAVLVLSIFAIALRKKRTAAA